MELTRTKVVRYAGLILAWMVLRSAPLTAQGPSGVAVPELNIATYELPNGLRVALSRDPQAPLTTVCVTYHVGSKNERAGLTGFAHFFEHMMFRGTRNVPNFDVPLQEAGGSPNAFTSNDVTVYFESIPVSYLERALYMEAERMAFLPTALDPMKFDTEREIVKNERRQRMENVPYGLASETISASVFPEGHPYSWSVIGTMKDLDNATLLDLRKFFWEFYHPGNATLTVVGNFDVDQTKQWIEKYFGPLVAGEKIRAVDVPETQASDKRMVQLDQVQFPRVYWAWPTVPESHPDAAALDLLATMLADGDASRLEKALVVDRQLASQVSASSNSQEIDGAFTIYATATPNSPLEAIEKVLAEELQRVVDETPSADELSRAFAKHENSVLNMLTSCQNRAFMIGMGLAQYDNAHHYQTYITDYARVTVEDIRRVAKKYLTTDKFALSVVPADSGQAESAAILAAPKDGVATAAAAERLVKEDDRWRQLPAPTSGADIQYPTIERHALSNGLQVWVSPWRTLPLVSVQLLIPSGAADNAAELAGLATLTARSWDKGTQQLSSTEFAEALDTLGVSLSVAAGTDTTQMSFSVGKSRLDKTLALVGQLAASPRFDKNDIEREKKLLLAQLARIQDDPSQIAARVYPRLLYGKDHPYGRPTQGYTDTVSQLDADQVREFYESRLRPDGATLIVVGDVDTEALLPNLERTWGQWQGSSTVAQRPGIDGSDAVRPVYVVDKPEAVQSVLMVSRIWKSRTDPAYFALEIGNRVLGGDFLSRLNQNLRERNGFTYGARSLTRYRRLGSDWLLQTSVRADVTAAALQEIIKELDGAEKSRPLTDEEIATARDAELNTLPEAFETPSSIAATLADLAIYGLPNDYLPKERRQFESVATGTIRATLTELLAAPERVILVVGDRKTIEPQLKEAGFSNLKFLSTDGS